MNPILWHERQDGPNRPYFTFSTLHNSDLSPEILAKPIARSPSRDYLSNLLEASPHLEMDIRTPEDFLIKKFAGFFVSSVVSPTLSFLRYGQTEFTWSEKGCSTDLKVVYSMAHEFHEVLRVSYPFLTLSLVNTWIEVALRDKVISRDHWQMSEGREGQIFPAMEAITELGRQYGILTPANETMIEKMEQRRQEFVQLNYEKRLRFDHGRNSTQGGTSHKPSGNTPTKAKTQSRKGDRAGLLEAVYAGSEEADPLDEDELEGHAAFLATLDRAQYRAWKKEQSIKAKLGKQPLPEGFVKPSIGPLGKSTLRRAEAQA